MQSRCNIYSKIFTLIVILLLPIISVSQIKTGIDSSMVQKPSVIPIINILGNIDDAKDQIKSVTRKLRPKSDIIKIDSLYPFYAKFIQEQKSHAKNFIKANPNIQKIDNLILKWQTYNGHLNGWEIAIKEFQIKNSRLIQEIEFSEETWALTYQNAKENKAPKIILNNVKTVWDDLISLKTSAIKDNNYFLILNSKINMQIIDIDNVVDDLIDLKNSNVYNLLYLRHEPLWKTSFNAEAEKSGKSDKTESFSKSVSSIFKFVKTNENNFYIYLIMVAFFSSLILIVKKAFVKYNSIENNIDLQKAKDIILNNSLFSILFLSVFIAKLFFTNAPKLFGDLLLVSMLLFSIPLLKNSILERFRKIIYFLILFFIFDSLKTYVWFSSGQYRLYLLGEALVLIFLIFYFTHPYRETRKINIGKFGLLLIRFTPVIYFLSIVCILSNILGYTNLADFSLKIGTQSGLITILFYTLLLISEGICIGLIHRHFCIQDSFDVDKKLTTQKKALYITRVFVFLFWILYFLKIVDLWSQLNIFLQDALTEPYKIGSITFTIGAILTFVIILAISYLITSLISFSFDGNSSITKALNLPKGVPAAISLVIRYFIIAFGFVLALSSIGIDLSKFNLMAGALGLGIGFGLQNIVSNFISGLILVFERPILPGDTIEVNNLLGTVKKIGVRSSSINTFDGAEVIVPNTNLISNNLINWTLSDNVKRVEILIGTTYDSDPNEVLKILFDVASKNEQVLKSPSPMALFSDFGDSSLNFKLLFWVPYEIGLSSKSNVSIEVYNRFKELGIQIPFPQRDVYIKNMKESGTLLNLDNISDSETSTKSK